MMRSLLFFAEFFAEFFLQTQQVHMMLSRRVIMAAAMPPTKRAMLRLSVDVVPDEASVPAARTGTITAD